MNQLSTTPHTASQKIPLAQLTRILTMKNKQQWNSLVFHGPAFIPYKRLPSHVTLRYNREPVRRLSDAAEEAIVNYSGLLLSKNANTKKRAFNANFFQDLQSLLSTRHQRLIRRFDQLDFSRIVAHLKLVKTSVTKSKKLQKQRRNLELKERHGFCRVDGVKVALGSWTVEPAGIFIGRPGNPRHGRIKLRIHPEHVIVNCSNTCTPPPGHRWREKLTDRSAVWVARYANNLGERKYILFGNESKFRRTSDEAKFKAAQNLGNRITRIRSNYERLISSRSEADRQLGLAIYFIDRFALRVGHEKGRDAADTVGCTTLRKEHISVKSGKRVCLDFKGKDSIRFKNDFTVPESVHRAIRRNILTKKKKDEIFNLLNAQTVNEYLKEIDKNLTAKVFRTFNASQSFQAELLKMSKSSTLSNTDKLFHYKKANLKVAKLCNHQKSVNLKIEIRTQARLVQNLEKKREKIRLLKRRLKNSGQSHKLQKVQESLKAGENNLWLRQNGREFSLATAQANYLDPRITVAWSKKNKVPLDKIWNKTLRKKYSWAEKTSQNFRF